VDFRIVRAVKNRFGSTNEIGVFEMCDTGVKQVEDPSGLFLSGQHVPGCCVTCAMEGTRPMLAEIQALLSQNAYGSPRRTVSGIDNGQLAVLLAVLERKANLRLSDKDIYINIVGGLKLFERAIDLGIALCIASCLLDIPLPKNMAALGEMGLTGEIRTVSHLEKRIRECVRLGFDRILIPKVSSAISPALQASVVPVATIAEAVSHIMQCATVPPSCRD